MVDVYLWLYHTDLWPEFYDILYPIKDRIVLHLALCLDNSLENIVTNTQAHFPHNHITYHRNAGGDILPFLTDFSNNANKQPLFIKIHTKKSKLLNRIQWRNILLNAIIGPDGRNFDNNRNYLSSTFHVGLLTHKGLLLSNQEGSNSKKINEILDYYNISTNAITRKTFAAGTMFMAKSEIYSSFFSPQSLPYLTRLLEHETGHVSDIHQGRYCHSLERIFGYLCEYQNYKISWAKYRTIPIINAKSPTRKLHLTITYNNYAYIEENISVHGQVLHCSDTNFSIEWHHLSQPIVRQYRKIGYNTYIGY